MVAAASRAGSAGCRGSRRSSAARPRRPCARSARSSRRSCRGRSTRCRSSRGPALAKESKTARDGWLGVESTFDIRISPGLLVEDDEIRERAARVDARPDAHRHRLAREWVAQRTVDNQTCQRGSASRPAGRGRCRQRSSSSGHDRPPHRPVRQRLEPACRGPARVDVERAAGKRRRTPPARRWRISRAGSAATTARSPTAAQMVGVERHHATRGEDDLDAVRLDDGGQSHVDLRARHVACRCGGSAPRPRSGRCPAAGAAGRPAASSTAAPTPATAALARRRDRAARRRRRGRSGREERAERRRRVPGAPPPTLSAMSASTVGPSAATAAATTILERREHGRELLTAAAHTAAAISSAAVVRGLALAGDHDREAQALDVRVGESREQADAGDTGPRLEAPGGREQPRHRLGSGRLGDRARQQRKPPARRRAAPALPRSSRRGARPPPSRTPPRRRAGTSRTRRRCPHARAGRRQGSRAGRGRPRWASSRRDRGPARAGPTRDRRRPRQPSRRAGRARARRGGARPRGARAGAAASFCRASAATGGPGTAPA